MFISSWLRQIHRPLFGPASAGQRRVQKASPVRRRARPVIEELENRLTPTTLTPTVFTADFRKAEID
jgi:hypothetical protein